MPETQRAARNHLDQLDIATLDQSQLKGLQKAEEEMNAKDKGGERVFLVALAKPPGYHVER
ncbi:MAG: hypothetical protein ACYC6I_02465 [Bacillota bacterium]